MPTRLLSAKTPSVKLPSVALLKHSAIVSTGVCFMLVNRLPERERFVFERLEPEPPPSGSVAFAKDADFHSLHFSASSTPAGLGISGVLADSKYYDPREQVPPSARPPHLRE